MEEKLPHFIARFALFLCTTLLASAGFSAGPEKTKVTIAVGGKATLFYLPLTLAERLGYFKDEGLSVEIPDFPGGAKSLQALMGGSADVVAGGFDHTIVMQTKGQKLAAFALMGASPGISLGVNKALAASYKGPADLKGKKVGVTAPGSTTHMVLNHLLSTVKLTADDVSVVGVGTGASVVAAVKSGQVDAVVNIEPAMSMLERGGDLKIVHETTTPQGVRAVFGGPMLAGCLYTKVDFVKSNPNTVQALTNAMVRALKWLRTATPDQLAATVPPEYLMGDKVLYLSAFARVRQTYSTDGLIAPEAVQSTYKVLAANNPEVRGAPAISLDQTYDNSFVRKALADK
jgi:NitT/TauT family transport system substrate-binding protein